MFTSEHHTLRTSSVIHSALAVSSKRGWRLSEHQQSEPEIFYFHWKNNHNYIRNTLLLHQELFAPLLAKVYTDQYIPIQMSTDKQLVPSMPDIIGITAVM